MAVLKRTLGLFETSFFAVGVILGAGIYTIVGEVAGISGNMIWLSFLISSVTALCTGFSYAELSSMLPKAGGEFSYLKETVSNKLGYITGIAVAFCGILGAATISVGFAGYASTFLDINKTVLALMIIAALLAVNISGIRQSSTTNIIFTLIEVGGLIFVIWSARDSIGDIDYLKMPDEKIPAILSGAALSFFAFTGFEDTVKLAEETKDPEKTIPKALFISITFVIIFYLAVVIAAVSAVSPEALGKASNPLSLIVEGTYGKTGILIITIIALFSTSNSLLSNMLGASRITYGMAEEKKVPYLSKVSGKTKTPVFALLLIAIISGLFALIGDIKTIALIANFFVFSTFLLVNIAVIVYRIREKEKERPFRIPFEVRGIPVIPVIAIIMILILIAFAVKELFS